MTGDARENVTPTAGDAGPRRWTPAERAAALTRFIAWVPVLGLFAGAVTLVMLAAVETYRVVLTGLAGDLSKKEALLGFIELADVFLLGVVLYIMALGLFELFIDDRLPLPHWLEFHSLDDLKEKLVGVVVVVLAVSFLGKVIESSDALGTMRLGLGIAATTLALAAFQGKLTKK